LGSRDGIGAITLFEEYDLLANSGLVDAEYYVKSNPDIAALNGDPLLHYVEWGCRERRNPSASFDTAHCLKLCKTLGETPDNALAHYLRGTPGEVYNIGGLSATFDSYMANTGWWQALLGRDYAAWLEKNYVR
jgi:hypothetical protein